MNLLHFRYRDRLGLLAEGVLSPAEAREVTTHVEGCAACRAELDSLRAVGAALAADAALDRALPISSDALRTRVLAQIRAEAAATARPRAFSFAPVLGALSLVALGLAAGLLATRLASEAPATVATTSTATAPRAFEASAETALNDTAFYERIEKTHLRANAARYLAEAQDVLVQVAAAADCPDSPKDSVDVTRESRTSRTLLSRRAALVADSGDALMSARGVLEEVEGVLQQVADLPQCTRRTDVNAIARRVDRKNLLMKIDLVSQELAAP